MLKIIIKNIVLKNGTSGIVRIDLIILKGSTLRSRVLKVNSWESHIRQLKRPERCR